MKKSGTLLVMLLSFWTIFAQKFGDNKSAKIISFRIEANNSSIDTYEILTPLQQQLIRVLRFSNVSLGSNTSLQ